MTHGLQYRRQGRREAPWLRARGSTCRRVPAKHGQAQAYTVKKCRRHSETPQAVHGSTSGSLGELLVPRVQVSRDTAWKPHRVPLDRGTHILRLSMRWSIPVGPDTPARKNS